MLAHHPGEAPNPAREPRKVAVEDREFREQRDEAEVERAAEKLFPLLQGNGKIDQFALEFVELAQLAARQ